MSYRLITKATLAIKSADGKTMEREVECRAYPAPKRDNAGLITIDGNEVGFKRTGGKGRGTQDHRYMYATVKGVSAFWPITEAEATAAVGGQVKMTSLEPKTEEVTVKASDVKAVARRVKQGEKVTA